MIRSTDVFRTVLDPSGMETRIQQFDLRHEVPASGGDR